MGIAVRAAAGDNEGLMPGGVAVVGAILALLVGKYAAVHLLVSHHLTSSDIIQVTAESMQVGLADEVVGEWTDAGKPVNWPGDMTIDDAESQADYPADVWAEAVKRWNQVPPDEQQQQIQERQQQIAALTDMFRGQITDAGFRESFSGIDLLFFGLAIYTAFKVGSGMASE